MNTRTRLQTIEAKAAKFPRTGAELVRQQERLPESARDQWLAALTDAELIAYGQELNRQAWAKGESVYDLSVLTDVELEQVCAGDAEPLARCPVIPPPSQQHGAQL